jgi:hypothetical protein
MGIDIESARFLLQSSQAGMSFHRCLLLGRQHFYLGKAETRALFREFGLAEPLAEKIIAELDRSPYSEPFWPAVGTQQLDTLDASDYEGATLIHDLNLPPPDSLRARFDAVCDFGTLEHVFNFPGALKSCLEMVAVGGRFIAHTTANNYCGHSFYQFSPELFYRALSLENGFAMERMIAVEYGPRRRWYEVQDPNAVRARVSLINAFPVLLFVQAKRVAAVDIFARWPQQSDYAAMWEQQRPGTPGVSTETQRTGGPLAAWKRGLLETFPSLARSLEAVVTACLKREHSWSNRRSFKPTSKGRLDLPSGQPPSTGR